MTGRCDRQVRNRSFDLFGFADIAAIKWPYMGVRFIQCTNRANHANRVAKLLGPRRAAVRQTLLAGNAVEVWSWHPHRDDPRIEKITADMVGAVTPRNTE